jgi:hypothetical protein
MDPEEDINTGEPISERTVRNYMNILKALFRTAMELEALLDEHLDIESKRPFIAHNTFICCTKKQNTKDKKRTQQDQKTFSKSRI